MTGSERMREKLVELAEYIADLETAQNLTWQEFTQDKLSRRGIERTLQMAVECLLDLASMLIAANRWRAPETNRDAFLVLVEHAVLPAETLPRYEKMAGFRNILVHEYSKVDPAIVYAVLKNGQADFVAFADAITNFLRHV